MRIYRVHMDGYGDGYDDYDTQEEAEQAAREWCAEYGAGEARVEIIEERRTAMITKRGNID